MHTPSTHVTPIASSASRDGSSELRSSENSPVSEDMGMYVPSASRLL